MKAWFAKGELAWQKYVCNEIDGDEVCDDQFNTDEESINPLEKVKEDSVIYSRPEDGRVESRGKLCDDASIDDYKGCLSDDCANNLFQGLHNELNRQFHTSILGSHRVLSNEGNESAQAKFILCTICGRFVLLLSDLSALCDGKFIAAKYAIKPCDGNQTTLNEEGYVAFNCDDKGFAAYNNYSGNKCYLPNDVEKICKSVTILTFCRHVSGIFRTQLFNKDEKTYVYRCSDADDERVIGGQSNNIYELEATGFDAIQRKNGEGRFTISLSSDNTIIAYGCGSMYEPFSFVRLRKE